MKYRLWISLAAAALAAPIQLQAQPAAAIVEGNPARWNAAKAQAWYARQDWILGANYANAGAINQLDMWQAATFDPAEIDKELGWASKFGMNTMRVYLHDLAYQQDPEGFKQRLDRFLGIAKKHGIRPMLVLFDSCWDPEPKIGPQHRPIPGVHTSGWLQSPGRRDLLDPAQDARLRRYVEDVVGSFAKDERILLWDLWNEPDNWGGGHYEDEEIAQELRRIEFLLPQTFAWARSQKPVQPLSSGVWAGDDWSPGAAERSEVQRIQLTESDVITFHDYGWPESFEARVAQLRPYGRPLVCTEWLARSAGSTPDTILPIAHRENIGMVNWGFVQGAIQTHFPWDSWDRPYTLKPPTVWFHDLLHPDGRPYRDREAELFRSLSARKAGQPAADRAR